MFDLKRVWSKSPGSGNDVYAEAIIRQRPDDVTVFLTKYAPDLIDHQELEKDTITVLKREGIDVGERNVAVGIVTDFHKYVETAEYQRVELGKLGEKITPSASPEVIALQAPSP